MNGVMDGIQVYSSARGYLVVLPLFIREKTTFFYHRISSAPLWKNQLTIHVGCVSGLSLLYPADQYIYPHSVPHSMAVDL